MLLFICLVVGNPLYAPCPKKKKHVVEVVAPVDAVGCGLHESIDKDVPADGHYDAAGERAQRRALGGSVVVLRENKGACQCRLRLCVCLAPSSLPLFFASWCE
jgi:hypothetical protein